MPPSLWLEGRQTCGSGYLATSFSSRSTPRPGGSPGTPTSPASAQTPALLSRLGMKDNGIFWYWAIRLEFGRAWHWSARGAASKTWLMSSTSECGGSIRKVLVSKAKRLTFRQLSCGRGKQSAFASARVLPETPHRVRAFILRDQSSHVPNQCGARS